MGALLISIFTSLFGGLFNLGKSAIDASVITGVATLKYTSGVTIAAMSHRVFWVAWGVAAIPMAAWFGWGMLDTLANGALPDVAVIPPGLAPYAEVVWGNIFYIGAGTAAIGQGLSLIEKIWGR